jgi:hypothetical protein
MNNPATQINPEFVRIGHASDPRARILPFTSFKHVSQVYCETRDRLGWTVSGATGPIAQPCNLLDSAGNVLAYVSYSGRIFPGDYKEWSASTAILYDNTKELAK